MKKIATVLVLVVAAVLLLSSFAAAAPMAATINVNPGDSIQTAINGAAAGDTIVVAAGTYVENLTIDRSLTLLGPNNGEQARATEAVIQGQITLTAPDVSLIGFTITNPGGTRGIFGNANAGATGNYEIAHNIFDDIGGAAVNSVVKAIYFTNGPDNINIHDNFFFDVAAGTQSADAINIGDSTHTNPANGVVIHRNWFKGISSATRGAYGIKLNLGAGMPGAVVTQNRFENISGGWTHAVGMEGPTPGAIVQDNSFYSLTAAGSDNAAVFFEDNPDAPTVTVTGNNFEGGFFGVSVHDDDITAYNYTVIAENNWWNKANGPGPVGPGTGTPVDTNVDFDPWLTVQDFPKSTNPINRANGTLAHVDVVSRQPGTITVEFIRPQAYFSCFEYRTDGDIGQIRQGENNFLPQVPDYPDLYPYFCFNSIGTTEKTFAAKEYVEFRLTFGAEGEERFDWTRFDVQGANIELVTEGNVGLDWFRTNVAGAGTAVFVDGPPTPPIGDGSLEMAVTGAGADKMTFFKYDYGLLGTEYGDGIPLADITAFGYSTYTDNTAFTPVLQMEIDTNGPAVAGGYTTLNFEPKANPANVVVANTWQSWDVINHSTSRPSIWTTNGTFPQGGPTTWATVVSTWPDATIMYGFGANVGSGWGSAMTGSVDNLRIGTDAFTDIFNMENLPYVSITPPDDILLCGGNETLDIAINDVTDLYGYQIEVSYDETAVTATGAFDNIWFDTTTDAFVVYPPQPGPPPYSVCYQGDCLFAATKTINAAPISGSGTVATLELAPLAAGSFTLTFDVVLTDIDGFRIPAGVPVTEIDVDVCGYATVSGEVDLQGRRPIPIDDGAMKLIDTDGNFPDITGVPFLGSDGTYSFTNVPVHPDGSDYRLEAAHLLYLSNELEPVTLNPGDAYVAAKTGLRGGDANNSGIIDILDGGCIGSGFLQLPVTTCGGQGSGDINLDGTVNIQDLAIFGGNYQLQTFQAWLPPFN